MKAFFERQLMSRMSCSESNLKWLQKWYFENCDGDWEHAENVHITTIDNPGWRIRIDLSGTKVEKKKLEKTKVENNELDWCFSWAEDGVFFSYGGPFNLDDMLGVFRRWVENN